MKSEAVLLVDDDPNARALVNFAFELDAGDVPVAYVENGRAAIDYLQSKPPYEERTRPGLMLLDLKMPVMDGFDVLDWLKRCPELRPRYVVVFSTSDQQVDYDRAWAAGADGYMVKPAGFAELRQMVSAVAFFARNGQWPIGEVEGVELRKRV